MPATLHPHYRPQRWTSSQCLSFQVLQVFSGRAYWLCSCRAGRRSGGGCLGLLLHALRLSALAGMCHLGGQHAFAYLRRSGRRSGTGGPCLGSGRRSPERDRDLFHQVVATCWLHCPSGNSIRLPRAPALSRQDGPARPSGGPGRAAPPPRPGLQQEGHHGGRRATWARVILREAARIGVAHRPGRSRGGGGHPRLIFCSPPPSPAPSPAHHPIWNTLSQYTHRQCWPGYSGGAQGFLTPRL